MSLIQTAFSMVSQYGFKGAATLTPIASSTNDLDNLSITNTNGTPLPLMAYVGKYPTSRVDGKTILATDRKVMAVPDTDWDGTIVGNETITIDGKDYNIEDFDIQRVGPQVAKVEIQCRG